MNDEKELEIRPDELESADDVVEDVEFEELDWVGDEKKDKEKLKNLRADLKTAQAESREHLTALQRSRADYVNLKKELDEVRDSVKAKTTERVIMDFLPVIDSFDMAMANTDAWNAVDANWRVGVEYIYTQFKTVLENYNVSAIDSAGVDFDPNLHEPMKTEDTDDRSQDDKIKQIIQKGYKMGDKVIRPARVVVWKAK